MLVRVPEAPPRLATTSTSSLRAADRGSEPSAAAGRRARLPCPARLLLRRRISAAGRPCSSTKRGGGRVHLHCHLPVGIRRQARRSAALSLSVRHAVGPGGLRLRPVTHSLPRRRAAPGLEVSGSRLPSRGVASATIASARRPPPRGVRLYVRLSTEGAESRATEGTTRLRVRLSTTAGSCLDRAGSQGVSSHERRPARPIAV